MMLSRGDFVTKSERVHRPGRDDGFRRAGVALTTNFESWSSTRDARHTNCRTARTSPSSHNYSPTTLVVPHIRRSSPLESICPGYTSDHPCPATANSTRIAPASPGCIPACAVGTHTWSAWSANRPASYVAAGSDDRIMDTSYLSQQVTTIIERLHGFFDEIGVPSHERDSRESEVYSTVTTNGDTH